MTAYIELSLPPQAAAGEQVYLFKKKDFPIGFDTNRDIFVVDDVCMYGGADDKVVADFFSGAAIVSNASSDNFIFAAGIGGSYGAAGESRSFLRKPVLSYGYVWLTWRHGVTAGTQLVLRGTVKESEDLSALASFGRPIYIAAKFS